MDYSTAFGPLSTLKATYFSYEPRYSGITVGPFKTKEAAKLNQDDEWGGPIGETTVYGLDALKVLETWKSEGVL